MGKDSPGHEPKASGGSFPARVNPIPSNRTAPEDGLRVLQGPDLLDIGRWPKTLSLPSTRAPRARAHWPLIATAAS